VLAHGPEEQLVVDAVEEALDVDIDDPVVAPATLARRPDRIDRRTAGPIAIGVGMERLSASGSSKSWIDCSSTPAAPWFAFTL
jgi:hypothetical protein